MKFKELDILGAWRLEPEMFSDERGVFRRHFCKKEFEEHGLDTHVLQGNISENPHLHTMRGFHYQLAPHAESKTISCLSGAIYDIIVDIRPGSKTFLKWTAVTISASDRSSLHIPAGCANAYLTIAPATLVHYYMSALYEPGSYRGFCYDDPSFVFEWPAKPQVISERDRNLPRFARTGTTD